MIKESKEFYISAVSTAILNKYRDTSPDEIAEAVSTIVDEIKGDNESKLVSRLRPVRSFVDDIKNQTVVLIAYGLKLIVTAGDGRVNQLVGERDFVLPNVEQPFKVLPGWETVDLLRRGHTQIPEENLVTVGVEAERQFTTILFLDIVAILFALFAAPFSIFG